MPISGTEVMLRLAMRRTIGVTGLVLSLAVGCTDAVPETEQADRKPIDETSAQGLPIVDRAIEFHGGALYEASTTSLPTRTFII